MGALIIVFGVFFAPSVSASMDRWGRLATSVSQQTPPVGNTSSAMARALGKECDEHTTNGVALCIVGQIRTMYGSESVKAVLMQTRTLHADNFLALARQPVLEQKLRKAARSNQLVKFRFMHVGEIISAFAPKRHMFYNSSQHRDFPPSNCSYKLYWQWTATWYPLRFCLQMIRDAERERCMPYKLVAKIRPDVQLAFPLDAYSFPSLKKKKPVVVGNLLGFNGCTLCDQWALMTRSAADAYFSVHEAFRSCDSFVHDLAGKSCGNEPSCPFRPSPWDPEKKYNLECFWLRWLASNGVGKKLSNTGPQVAMLSFAKYGQPCWVEAGKRVFGGIARGSCWKGTGKVMITVRNTCPHPNKLFPYNVSPFGNSAGFNGMAWTACNNTAIKCRYGDDIDVGSGLSLLGIPSLGVHMLTAALMFTLS